MATRDIQSRLTPITWGSLAATVDGTTTTATSIDTADFDQGNMVILGATPNAAETGSFTFNFLHSDVDDFAQATPLCPEGHLPTRHFQTVTPDYDDIQSVVENEGIKFVGTRWDEIAPTIPTIGCFSNKRYIWLQVTAADIAAGGYTFDLQFVGHGEYNPDLDLAGKYERN